jgi:hypothetical protein
MPLTPSQILSANRQIFGDSGGGYSALASLRSRKQDELDRILEQKDEDEPSPGIWDTIKSTAGDVIAPVARTLDLPRAALVAGALELGDVARVIGGKESTGADFNDNINRRVGFGDVLEENTLTENLPHPVKQVLGGVGDIALDPLNYALLGPGAAAKAGIKRVGVRAGDEVAGTLARQGVDEANTVLARQWAQDEADAILKETASAARKARRAGTAPPPGPVRLPRPAPTIQDLLAEGATQRGLSRTLSQIERTGKGGIGFDFGRFSKPGTLLSKARISGDTLAKFPGAQGAAGLGLGFKESALGTGLRKAIVPYTATRDKFGEVIAEALPGIGHRRAQLVDSAKRQLDERIEPLLTDATRPHLDAIRAALETSDGVAPALNALADVPEAQKLLRRMAAVRDETYDAWIKAGKNPDQLLPKDEYLRHKLTFEGRQQYGVTDEAIRPGTKSGNLKQRKVEGTVDELNKQMEDAFGISAYEDDPVKLIGSAWNYAQEVLGNAGAVDALEDIASKIRGFDPETVVRHSSKKGFVQVAPNRYVAQEIYDDLFNLAKSGTQSSIVRGWDTFSSLVKRQTLFNPIAFGPYFAQNMATGVAMNAGRFGVAPSHYGRMFRLREGIKSALKEGGERNFDANLAAHFTDPTELEYARRLKAEDLVSAKRSMFDEQAGDLAFVGPSKARWVAELGTHKTAAANQFGEEMLRGSAFIKMLDEGIPANQASDLVRNTHLDYTALGRTRFERDKINRFVFFPTWLLRAPTAIVRSYAHRPALFNVQAKLELGKNWSDRPRNEYGDIIGSRWSGPTSFLSGLGFEGGDAFDKPVELLHPLLQAGLDEDSRKITDVLPPLSNVLKDEGSPTNLNFESSRLGKILGNEDGAAERYGKMLGGFRYGVDYDAEQGKDEFQQELDERREDRKDNPDLPETTPKIRLVLAALAAGVPAADAYRLNSGGLARALLDAGFTEDEISDILDDEDAKAPKKAQIQGITGTKRGGPPILPNGEMGSPTGVAVPMSWFTEHVAPDLKPGQLRGKIGG